MIMKTRAKKFRVIYTDAQTKKVMSGFFHNYTLEDILHEFEVGWYCWDKLHYVLSSSNIVWSKKNNHA